MKYQKFKDELKHLSTYIRTVCNYTKNASRTGVYEGPSGPALYLVVSEYRHKHIALCLVRGRTYLEVENKVREGNEPSWKRIKKYMEQINSDTQNVSEVSANDAT